MKIGFCAKPDQAARVAAAGFDDIEPPVNYLAGLTEEAFLACGQELRAAGIPAAAFNLLFPKSLSLLAEETDRQAVADYLAAAFGRVQQLGGTVAVFGSGKSRNRPESMSYGDAFRRLADLTRLTGQIADAYGITVVVEPLNRGETNMINSLGEGACLVAATHHPRVRLLADYYHISVESQPVEDIQRLSGIDHAHIATADSRRVPLAENVGYARMFRAMKATGYGRSGSGWSDRPPDAQKDVGGSMRWRR